LSKQWKKKKKYIYIYIYIYIFIIFGYSGYRTYARSSIEGGSLKVSKSLKRLYELILINTYYKLIFNYIILNY